MTISIGLFLENINPNSLEDMNAVLHNLETLLDRMPSNRLKLCFLAMKEEVIRQVRELRQRQRF